MLELGEYHKMIIDRDVSPGLYLRDAEENEVLLPGKYAPEGFQLEDEIEVFVKSALLLPLSSLIF